MTRFKKVTVLGGGAFGVALANLAAEKSNEIMLWVRDEKVCQSINDNRHHPTQLSHIFLPINILALTDLKLALFEADVVILALPMAALSPVLLTAQKFIHQDAIIVSTAKGIEEQSLALPCDVTRRSLSKNLSDRVCFLSGPSFAFEVAMNLPTALTLASNNKDVAISFQKGFSHKHFRLYRTDDVIGVCVGGALKNVVAIAAGACVGLGLGRNALAAVITCGLAEITRLAVSMGGRSKTISGLSGAGDLVLSCIDDMSRNHRLGMMLANGVGLNMALEKIGSVVEGARTTKTIPDLIDRYGVDLPISIAVHQVLYDNLPIEKAVFSLLSREKSSLVAKKSSI
jgi:glycerol-3-phosphate dehydrogenase (NAD(P)+)